MTVALITGATGGLGRALAFEHDRHGGDLILVARNEMKLASLVADLQHQCPASRVATVTADFAKGHTAAQVYQEVQGFDWPVDYLINNAGFGGQGKFIDRSLAADLTMLRVNAAVPPELMKLFLPGMVKRGRGRVLTSRHQRPFSRGPNRRSTLRPRPT